MPFSLNFKAGIHHYFVPLKATEIIRWLLITSGVAIDFTFAFLIPKHFSADKTHGIYGRTYITENYI